MTTPLKDSLAVAGLLTALALTARGQAAPAPAESTPAGTAVLGNTSPLRGYLVFRTPALVTKDGEIKVPLEPEGKNPKPLADYQSPPPPPGWTAPDFDDSGWDPQRAPVEMQRGSASGGSQAGRYTATANSLLCLRIRFLVEDPARAQDLKLSVEYVGGVVVYLNGQELARGSMPAGEVKPETLAEKYPEDLYCEPEGMYLQNPKKNPAGFDRRYRKLADVAVPAKLLRKGANVLALELHRAPINEPAIAAKRVNLGGGMNVIPGLWACVGLKGLGLTSASSQGVVANVARPKGIQVWNVAPFETIDLFSFGDPGELRPISVHAVRNSVFSGRLAVGSDQDISNLKVAVSDLKLTGGTGTLPASAVRVRYAEPAVPEKCWTPPHRFNGLVETIPAKIPALKVPLPRGASPGPTSGAVASIWLTVRVPKATAAGVYEGTATVSAEGLAETRVPLRVKVNDWAMPDPKDFHQHHLIFVSQEAVAKHYGAPLWSDKHFELMGKSLALLAEVNAREIPMNLCRNFYNDPDGNLESMVRWIKQPDGSYKYDFSVFDKYLDLVAKHSGKPLPLRLNCWCNSTVSVLDPATGKLDVMNQPAAGTEEGYNFWKPVIDEVLKKLAARGWLDATAFGHSSYCWPAKPPVVDMARKLWPEGAWAYTAHNGTLGGAWETTTKGVSMPVKYSVGVWTEGELRPRGGRALLKPRPGIWSNTMRTRHWDSSSLVLIRNLPEEAILRGQDGVGDFGSDLFPIKKEKGGGYYCLANGRGTGGPNDAQRAILAPGPDGAVATERFEAFREGTELSEAVLYLEQALLDKKIGGELAAKVNRYLDERCEAFIKHWYDRAGSIWGGAEFRNRWSPPGLVDRDAELLALCAEVGKGK